MGAQAQMGETAGFTIRYDSKDALPTVLFDDGHGKVTEIAECSPTATPEQFEWLVNSAAAFHKKYVKVVRPGGDSDAAKA